ncbi:hypothetical protein IV77_GL001305 [Olsenella uli DSM 7084]|nr:hypothetical protein IV77_GL001305 [Olsenella uli DSM 7084]
MGPRAHARAPVAHPVPLPQRTTSDCHRTSTADPARSRGQVLLHRAEQAVATQKPP